MDTINFFVVGQVSTGKSSFINGLVGGMISSTSLNRETFKPTMYMCSHSGTFKNICEITKSVHIRKEENAKMRKENKIFSEEIASSIDKRYVDLPIPYNFNMCLYDFAGFGDASDTANNFYKAVENQLRVADLVIFTCDATKAFLSTSELADFKRLQTYIEKLLKDEQIYIKLVVVCTKYDEQDDKEINEIFNELPKKLGISRNDIFRVNTHQMFFHSAEYIYIPHESTITDLKKMAKSIGQTLPKGFNKFL